MKIEAEPRQLNVRIPRADLIRAKVASARSGVPLSHVARSALVAFAAGRATVAIPRSKTPDREPRR